MNKKIDLVLLAGGYAGSLRPITEFMPKVMLYLGNKPLIHRVLEEITNQCEINKIIIVYNHYKEIIHNYIELLRKSGVINNEIVYIDNSPSFTISESSLKNLKKDGLSNEILNDRK